MARDFSKAEELLKQLETDSDAYDVAQGTVTDTTSAATAASQDAAAKLETLQATEAAFADALAQVLSDVPSAAASNS